jgi:hypothetical protein
MVLRWGEEEGNGQGSMVTFCSSNQYALVSRRAGRGLDTGMTKRGMQF